MGTTRVIRSYAIAEFTAASGNPNHKIFNRELEAVGLSVNPTGVYKSGTDVILRWDDALPLAADITLIDTAVLAHAGGTTLPAAVRLEDEEVSSNSTDTWENKLYLETPLLVAGTYEVVWYAEIAADAVVTATAAQVRVVIGGVQEFSDLQAGLAWFPVSGTNFVDVLDGDTISIAIGYRKYGTDANMANIQKARVSIKPLES